MAAGPPTDALLTGVLAEAALGGEPYEAVTRAYPTLDALLSATLEEIAEVGGADEATRLWNVLERRWRLDSARGDVASAPPTSAFGQMIATGSADERPSSLRVQLRVQALLDVTMPRPGSIPTLAPRICSIRPASPSSIPG